jgi:hypothetical protein
MLLFCCYYVYIETITLLISTAILYCRWNSHKWNIR